MIVAVLLLVVLPTSPQRPKPLFFNGLIRFSDREQHILTARLGLDETPPPTHNARGGIPFSTVRKTLLNYRRWPHFISTACVFATWSPLTTYTPSIIVYAPHSQPNAFPLKSDPFQVSWLHPRPSKRPKRNRRLYDPPYRIPLRVGERSDEEARVDRYIRYLLLPCCPGRSQMRPAPCSQVESVWDVDGG